MFRIWKRFFGEERAAFLKARSTLPGRLSAALSDLEGHWRLLSTVVQRHLTASLRNLALRNPQSGQRRAGDNLQGRTELLRTARRPPRRQRQCKRDRAGQAPRGVRGGHERDGTDDPIRELTAQRGHDPVHASAADRPTSSPMTAPSPRSTTSDLDAARQLIGCEKVLSEDGRPNAFGVLEAEHDLRLASSRRTAS